MKKLTIQNLENLAEVFENIEKAEILSSAKRIGEIVRYYVNPQEGLKNYFCLCNGGESNEIYLHIYIDNFPARKKFFQSSLPFQTAEELQFLLRLGGVELEIKKPWKKVYSFDFNLVGSIDKPEFKTQFSGGFQVPQPTEFERQYSRVKSALKEKIDLESNIDNFRLEHKNDFY